MACDELEERVRAFVAEHVGVSRDQIRLDTDVVDDLRIDGDDVWELIADFGEEYKVDLSNFRWYHHAGPEGCNPFWLFFKPWWWRKTHVPIRLADLVASARRSVWSIEYPEHEREE